MPELRRSRGGGLARLALSPRERDQLDAFLAGDGGDCDLEYADGLFCALAVAPGPVEPAQWVPPLVGVAPALGAADAAGQRLLITRHCCDVITRLRRPREELDEHSFYLPVIHDPRGLAAPPQGERWARGFLAGIAASAADWDALAQDEEAARLLSPMVMLARGYDPGDPERHFDRDQLCELVPVAAYALRQWWLARGCTDAAGQRPRRVRPTGRNEPCPCGSGLKFKKCCGATHPTLH